MRLAPAWVPDARQMIALAALPPARYSERSSDKKEVFHGLRCFGNRSARLVGRGKRPPPAGAGRGQAAAGGRTCWSTAISSMKTKIPAGDSTDLSLKEGRPPGGGGAAGVGSGRCGGTDEMAEPPVKENCFAEFWRDTCLPRRPAPPLDLEDLVRRANAALDGLPSERRPSLGQKLRFSVVLAAVLAAAIHFNVLDALLPGRCLLR